MAHKFIDIVHPENDSSATVAEEAFEQTYKAKGWVRATDAGKAEAEKSASPLATAEARGGRAAVTDS